MSSSNPDANNKLHARLRKVIALAWRGSTSPVDSGDAGDDLDSSFSLRPGTSIIDRRLVGHGAPYWPESVQRIPEGGFGVLLIRVELDNKHMEER